MKNYLLTLAFFGLSSITFSCSESENITERSDNEIDQSDNSTSGEQTDNQNEDSTNTGSEENQNSEDTENESELVLTDCLLCPGYTLEQTTASGNDTTIIVEEAQVCKGENGKAYLDGILNEDFETYELYLENRQAYRRCN